MTCEGVLPEKRILEKAGTIKRFEYSPLDSVLRKQSGITKRQYQGLEKIYGFEKKCLSESLKKKNRMLKKWKRKKYNTSQIEFMAINIDFTNTISSILLLVFNRVKSKKMKTNRASKLYSQQLEKYSNEYYNVLDAKMRNTNPKYNPVNLKLSEHKLEEMFMIKD